MLKYPFQEQEPWPVEGFPMADGRHVQIRASLGLRGEWPFQGWEVDLCFSHGREYALASGHYIEIKDRTGKTLKANRVRQCIGRFRTEEEAYRFVHHMYQSKNKEHFFPLRLDVEDADPDEL
ncbi:MAG: hypothetical protein MPL62_16600 [Alphaproteobacteria bacterium]|nr:hypothetical protein [Alphaproteobacteria bacterium]